MLDGAHIAKNAAEFTRSFPDPSSSHTQSRRRDCPPMRNGSAACWRQTRSVRPAESRGDIRCGARCGPGGGEEDRWRGDRACSVQGKARLESGRRSQAKCASNITSKFVTLDVSQLSGWLNALAPRNISPMIVTRDVSQSSGWLNRTASCRVKKGGYDARRSVGWRT